MEVPLFIQQIMFRVIPDDIWYYRKVFIVQELCLLSSHKNSYLEQLIHSFFNIHRILLWQTQLSLRSGGVWVETNEWLVPVQHPWGCQEEGPIPSRGNDGVGPLNVRVRVVKSVDHSRLYTCCCENAIDCVLHTLQQHWLEFRIKRDGKTNL